METVRAIDALLDGGSYADAAKVVLLIPPSCPPPVLRNIEIRRQGWFRGGYAWEQFDLPRLARSGVLLGLCNLGPVVKRDQVIVVHDATPKVMPRNFSRGFRLAYGVLIPILGRVAARIVTITAFSRSEIARWYGLSPAGIEICGEGGEHIRNQPSDPGILDRHDLRVTPYFLAVGVGSSNKNVETVIAAFKKASFSGVKLVMTGRRSARVHPTASVQPAAEDADMEDALVYAGHVSDGELRALYEQTLALVYPSRYEGFGLPPIEAMACGCPVIISDQAALLEVAGADGAALVTGMDDVEGLAGQLSALHADAGLRQSMADRGRLHAARFEWSRTAAILLDLCLKIAR
jgi:glycosyltransferase involved in cell wall biosynthesis